MTNTSLPTDSPAGMSPQRAAEIRDLLHRAGNAAEDRTVLLDAALDLQLHADALQRRIRDLETADAQAVPDRMAVLRPEYLEHASVENIDLAINRARSNRTRWNTRLTRLQALRAERLDQIAAGTWPALPPAEPTADGLSLAACLQNRTNQYFDLTDPVILGEHVYRGPESNPRCIYCDHAGINGGDTAAAPVIPTYVSNADSVNVNTAKHFVDPDDASRTWCTRAFRASAPLPPEQAALIAICGGCRRAATAQD